MEHFIEIEPAFDKRHPDPEKNYGIHGSEIRMLSRGEYGVVQFLIFTHRMLPHITEEFIENYLENYLENTLSDKELRKIRKYSGDFTKGKELEEVIEFYKFVNQLELGTIDCLIRPNGADLGYHSPKPLYEGQEPIRAIYKEMELIHLPNGDLDFVPPVYGDPIICKYLLSKNSICYYDGSGLHGNEAFDILIKNGIESVWNYLDKCYEDNLQSK